jgi:tetratricopeptide (TPR) repeat protein
MHFWRKAFFLLVLTGLLCYLAYGQVTTYRVTRHTKAADQALAQFDFQKAQSELEAALQIRPDDAQLHLRLASVARRSNQFELAEEHIRESQQISGESQESLLEFAMLKAQRGDLTGSQDFLLSQLRNNTPEAPLILEALAQGAMHNHLLGLAKNYLDELVERQPDHYLAFEWRGRFWELSISPERALEDYGKVIELRPSFLEARLNLAQVLIKLSRGDEAIEHLEVVRKQLPDDPMVLLGLARCWRQRGDLDKAEEFVARVLKSHPNIQEAVLMRGIIYLDLSKNEAAEPVLRRAVKLAPYDRESNFQMAKCLRLLGRESEEKPYTDRVKEIDATRLELNRVTDQIRKSPNDPDLRRKAAELSLHCHRDSEALGWLEGALQINPKHKPTHSALADLYEQFGRSDLAAKHRQASQGP